MRALVAGTVSLDLFAPSISSTFARATVGSTGANVAIRLATKGWHVELVGLVGQDRPGQLVRDELDGWGVDTNRLVARPGIETPIVYQVARSTGDPFLRRCPRCGRSQARHGFPTPDELTAARVQPIELRAAVFDCGGQAESMLLTEVVDRGALIWAELSALANADPLANRVVSTAWVRKCSSEDEALLEQFDGTAEGNSPLTIITLGEKGVRFRQAGNQNVWRYLNAAALPGTPTDPIGAGDAFTASGLDAMLRLPAPTEPNLEQLDSTLRYALAEAALVVTKEGANGDLVRSPNTRAHEVPFACAKCALLADGGQNTRLTPRGGR